MWAIIIGFVLVCTVMAVVIARRGPGDGADHSAGHGPYGGAGLTGGGDVGGDGGGF